MSTNIEEQELIALHRARTSHENRLREETTKFFETEGRLKGLRRRRTMLALKLFEMGLSERAIGGLAGVSGACVHQWREKFKKSNV